MTGRALFLYGTLQDPDLLAAVLGRRPAPADLHPAILPGHAVRRVAPGGFPIIEPCDDAHADGTMLRGLDGQDIARLAYYEGEGYYTLEHVEVETGDTRTRAQLFWPVPGVFATDGPWSLAAWQAADQGISAETAREVMDAFGTRSSAEMVLRHPQMRARAQSRLTARRSSGIGAGPDRDQAVILKARRPYAEFFNVEEYELDLPRFSGGRYRPDARAVFVAVDAVNVLPYDPVRDRVLLIEQFRAGPFARGDTAPWVLETVAGRRDPGESFEDTARREALEEAGLTLTGLEHVAAYYPSPGCLSEYIMSYIGLAELPDEAAGLHGLAEEGEDIRSHVLSFDAFMAALDSGQVNTAPLVITALWLARNRARLRATRGA